MRSYFRLQRMSRAAALSTYGIIWHACRSQTDKCVTWYPQRALIADNLLRLQPPCQNTLTYLRDQPAKTKTVCVAKCQQRIWLVPTRHVHIYGYLCLFTWLCSFADYIVKVLYTRPLNRRQACTLLGSHVLSRTWRSSTCNSSRYIAHYYALLWTMNWLWDKCSQVLSRVLVPLPLHSYTRLRIALCK